MPTPNIDIVQQRLEAVRQNLLDTSLRNKLVNYRTPKATGVEVVGEEPVEVYRILVTEGKAMTFTGKPDRGGESQEGNVPMLGGPNYEGEEADIYDRKLNTNEFSSRLQSRLLKTWRDAQASLEEQGVNVLFLALGMLEWYESDSSQELRRAPLVLIPVLLERRQGNQFRIRYDGTEVGWNLSLAAKLNQEFHIELPELPDTDTVDLRAYFEEVREAVGNQRRWQVNEQTIALGFFSYAKYLMYKDLEGLQWPDEAKPWLHSLLSALLDCGFDEEEAGISEEDHLDQHRPIDQIHEVCDADSSQVLAILEAKSGQSMIIEGPPGTGKSQTITNLIAEAIGEGKTVLFVAEKRAALEVVWRNLEKAGLHSACLELHSNKTNKKEFYTKLSETVELGKPRTQEMTTELNRLQKVRNELNTYCQAVHQTIEGRELIPLVAMGRLLGLGAEQEDLRKPNFTLMQGWTQAEFSRRRDLVEKIQAKVLETGPPIKNPFWGSRLRLLLPEDQTTILAQIKAANEVVQKAQAVSKALAEKLSLSQPDSLHDADQVHRCTLKIISAPPLQYVKVSAETWKTQGNALSEALKKGKRLTQLQATYRDLLKPEAWEAAVALDRQNLEKYGTKWWRFLNSQYRASISHLKALYCQKLPRAFPDRLATIDAILEAQEIKRHLASVKALAEAHFGAQWQNEQSNWNALRAVLEWVLYLHKETEAGILPTELLSVLERPHRKEGLAKESAEVSTFCSASTEHLARLLELLHAEGEIQQLPSWKFSDQLTMLTSWRDHIGVLEHIVEFNLLHEEARDQRIEPVADIAAAWDAAGERLVEAFERAWYGGVIREAFEARPVLARFRQDLEATVNAFRNLDRLMLEQNKTKVALKHWDEVPRHSAGGSLGILQREFAKNRGHKPIRKVMLESGVAIQAIKPVFMMSPLSVAMYLPPKGLRFDLAIFDEASQIKPEDSFGSIIRANQAIVVGDSKQMPPSSFFDKLTQAEEDRDEDEEVELNVTRDLESILALMDSKIPPRSRRRRDLRWHYRSQHDSLIAVSNRQFYKNRLVVFPSVDRSCNEKGLVFRHLPHTVYGRGGSRKNLEEARAVALAVVEHAKGRSHLSLGVAAFSAAQQEAIQDELDRLGSTEPALVELDRLHPHERVFVKNLENVQGDERDVVLISVGYGRDVNGFLSMNFGPLNKDGGERRLNVLITRARVRCEVFSNFRASDLRVSETRAAGVHALKTFLHFAETGDLDLPIPTGLEPMSPFEEAVIAALRGHGYAVQPQVGSAGFFVDIGVCDPMHHDRFVLGIECDGAKYHSARSARDRDRLRQEVLERRGWRIHRIWSTDWWRHHDQELRRTLEVIEQAIASCAEPPQVQPAPQSTTEVKREHTAQPSRQENSYVFANIQVHLGRRQLRDVPFHKISFWVQEVVEVESPVHFEEVVHRIREAAGLGRAGDPIRDAVRQGADYAAQTGRIKWDGDFLWRERIHPVSVRNRAVFPSAQKKLDIVHPIEIKAAIQQIVTDSFGISRIDCGVPVSRVLGFERATDAMCKRIDELLSELLRDEVLCEQNGQLRLSEK